MQLRVVVEKRLLNLPLWRDIF